MTVAYCVATNKKTSTTINLKLELDPAPILPAFVAKLSGYIKGKGLLSDTTFKLFYRDSCLEGGFQTQQITIPPPPRDLIVFSAPFTETPNAVVTSPAKWLELQNSSSKHLACCQFKP